MRATGPALLALALAAIFSPAPPAVAAPPPPSAPRPVALPRFAGEDKRDGDRPTFHPPPCNGGGEPPRVVEGAQRPRDAATESCNAAEGAIRSPAPPRSTAPLDRARVEAFVDGAVAHAMRRDRIAGVSVAIVDRAGVVLAKGYGLAGVSPARPADAATPFRVGSISKTITWIALMQLADAGRVSLDDPVNRYLPADLRLSDDGFAAPVRLRHLMTHSAGLEDSVLGGFFVRDPDALASTHNYLRSHRLKRVRPPGALSVYSNHGAALAGEIVAQVSGEPFETYAERHVLRPLGMTTATFREPYPATLARARGLAAPLDPALAARVSEGFELRAGRLEPQPWEYVQSVVPAGALSASALDMAAFMRALLDPALMAREGVLRLPAAEAIGRPMMANTPELGAWRHGFMDYAAARGRPGFGHGGDLIFQHATLEIYPDAGIGIFVAVNTASGAEFRDSLPEAFLDTFAGPPPPLPPPVADARAQGAAVAGTYRTLRLPARRTERAILALTSEGEVRALPDGDLLMVSGDRPRRWRPIGRGVFAAEDGPEHVAFHEVGGRMMRFDPYGIAPAERVGLFDTLRWLLGIALVGLVTAVWGVAAGVRRALGPPEPDRPAALLLDGLCLAWSLAFALTAAGAAALGDPDAAVYLWPGPVLPAGLWALAAAAIATPIAAIAAFGPLRPRAWSHGRWIRQGLALAAFAALALTLARWGLLGYRGW